ncbi:MAG: DNA polymerase III subunit alpha [Sphingomonadaceae bacterium]
MPHASFVPLRIFSAYSMLEGAIDPKEIASRARTLGFPAAAICDRNGLYGVMPFSDACAKAGVQPIIGTLLCVARPDLPQGAPPALDWLALYAQDATGYDNLCRLVSAAHLDRPPSEPPHVAFEALEERTEGLIALTGGAEGALAKLFADRQQQAATDYADRLRTLFPDRLYVELARRSDRIEAAAEPHLIALADGYGLPLIATNPTFYPTEDFHSAHDVLLCIANSAYVDSDDRVKSSRDGWLKPAHAMKALFEDLPEALDNTLVLAQRCAFAAPARKPILPSLAGDPEAEIRQLRADAHAGLNVRLAKIFPAFSSEASGPVERSETSIVVGSRARSNVLLASLGETGSWEAYRARLDFELDVIVTMGFAGYFLIVADFIKWAKAARIPVGPGRGSGAGSVVAWALTITDLDPLKLGLLFERFLNPDRVSMPDFDIDFCETRREEVIRYVQAKYGRDHVAQIITFGRLKSRAVLKDTGRVLQMSYGQVDRLAKLVPNHPTDPWDLKRALNGVSELADAYKSDTAVRRLFDLAMRLEGLPRHSSTHAAGVVIGDRPLDRLVPLYRDPRSDMPVTQFDMKYAEAAGLVKFDFLGLKTLSVLERALDLIEAREGHRPDLDTLAWDDEAIYALLQRGDTVGVFQMESEGMRRALTQVRPTAFGDIIAIGALYRPGPMDNIPMFADRKNGRSVLEYPHPLLEGILAETYGIFVYQEQVMQAGQILAGYSLGEADLLRRAMGKKIKAEMDAQRSRFVEGCTANAIGSAQANALFDLIDKFAGYGFNKSHAAAYAVLTYQTAWIKAHYPEDFFAASMAFDLSNTDKLAAFVDDMRRMRVRTLPPCLHASDADFTVESDDEGLAVRYALGALKGVGESAMTQLCAERAESGRFADLDDFAHRINPRLINRRQLESLAGGGAFDALTENRAGVFAVAETVLAAASAAQNNRTSGQGGLFGEGAASIAAIKLPQSAQWTTAERMAAEKDAFGFYFSAHPVDRYKHVVSAHGARTLQALSTQGISDDGTRTPASMAVLVEGVRWRTSARGNRYLLASLSDPSGGFEASCFDEGASRDLEAAAQAGSCVLLGCELDRRPGEEAPRVSVKRVSPLETLAGQVRLKAEIVTADPRVLPRLASLLTGARGGRSEIILRALLGHGREARIVLGRDFVIDGELADAIAALDGVQSASLNAEDSRPRLALAS